MFEYEALLTKVWRFILVARQELISILAALVVLGGRVCTWGLPLGGLQGPVRAFGLLGLGAPSGCFAHAGVRAGGTRLLSLVTHRP